MPSNFILAPITSDNKSDLKSYQITSNTDGFVEEIGRLDQWGNVTFNGYKSPVPFFDLKEIEKFFPKNDAIKEEEIDSKNKIYAKLNEAKLQLQYNHDNFNEKNNSKAKFLDKHNLLLNDEDRKLVTELANSYYDPNQDFAGEIQKEFLKLFENLSNDTEQDLDELKHKSRILYSLLQVIGFSDGNAKSSQEGVRACGADLLNKDEAKKNILENNGKFVTKLPNFLDKIGAKITNQELINKKLNNFQEDSVGKGIQKILGDVFKEAGKDNQKTITYVMAKILNTLYENYEMQPAGGFPVIWELDESIDKNKDSKAVEEFQQTLFTTGLDKLKKAKGELINAQTMNEKKPSLQLFSEFESKEKGISVDQEALTGYTIYPSQVGSRDVVICYDATMADVSESKDEKYKDAAALYQKVIENIKNTKIHTEGRLIIRFLEKDGQIIAAISVHGKDPAYNQALYDAQKIIYEEGVKKGLISHIQAGGDLNCEFDNDKIKALFANEKDEEKGECLQSVDQGKPCSARGNNDGIVQQQVTKVGHATLTSAEQVQQVMEEGRSFYQAKPTYCNGWTIGKKGSITKTDRPGKPQENKTALTIVLRKNAQGKIEIDPEKSCLVDHEYFISEIKVNGISYYVITLNLHGNVGMNQTIARKDGQPLDDNQKALLDLYTIAKGLIYSNQTYKASGLKIETPDLNYALKNISNIKKIEKIEIVEEDTKINNDLGALRKVLDCRESRKIDSKIWQDIRRYLVDKENGVNDLATLIKNNKDLKGNKTIEKIAAQIYWKDINENGLNKNAKNSPQNIICSNMATLSESGVIKTIDNDVYKTAFDIYISSSYGGKFKKRMEGFINDIVDAKDKNKISAIQNNLNKEFNNHYDYSFTLNYFSKIVAEKIDDCGTSAQDKITKGTLMDFAKNFTYYNETINTTFEINSAVQGEVKRLESNYKQQKEKPDSEFTVNNKNAKQIQPTLQQQQP